MMWHTFGQPVGIMAVTVSLTAGGVLQRFPDLRVGLLEGNCGWAPWLLDRLDEHWEWVGAWTRPDLDRAPSEYFRSNCYLSIEADEHAGAYYVDAFGDDNLVFSTDYPHGDSKYPHAVEAFLELPLTDDTKRKVAVGQLVPPLRRALLTPAKMGRPRARGAPSHDHPAE